MARKNFLCPLAHASEITRRLLLAVALAAGLPAATAASWPQKPVKLIVPFPAGAAPDVVARLLANNLSQVWNQAVVVENRPGAGGIPGMAALVRSAPDGHTLGFLPAAVLTLTPYLYKNPQFDVDRDLQPVALVGTSPMMLAVNASSGLSSLADLTRLAKSKPSKVNFAAAQTNSVPHLTGEMLSHSLGLGLYTVPYSGSQAAVTAVLAGDVDLTIDGLPALVQHVKAGKLRALAVTSDRRLPGFESIPTVAETSPGFEMIGWFGIFAPTGIAPALVDQINSDVAKALAQPEVGPRLADLGVYVRPGSSAALKTFLNAQRAQFKKAIDVLGLQPQ